MDLEEGSYKVATKVLKAIDTEMDEFSGDSEMSHVVSSKNKSSKRPAANAAASAAVVDDFQDSSGYAWTNDKHVSYLNSMEQAFVRRLYQRNYCSVDICGAEPESQKNHPQQQQQPGKYTPQTSYSSESCSTPGGCRKGETADEGNAGRI